MGLRGAQEARSPARRACIMILTLLRSSSSSPSSLSDCRRVT